MKTKDLVKQDEYILAEDDFQLIIAPNDVLEDQLSLIYGGAAPGACGIQSCGGGTLCNAQNCNSQGCVIQSCSTDSCNVKAPDTLGPPGQG